MSQGQPSFHGNTAYSQIHAVLASLHQQGHREAKDGEQHLDLLVSFWASSKIKAIATAGEEEREYSTQIWHTEACKYFAHKNVTFNKPTPLQRTKPHHKNQNHQKEVLVHTACLHANKRWGTGRKAPRSTEEKSASPVSSLDSTGWLCPADEAPEEYWTLHRSHFSTKC